MRTITAVVLVSFLTLQSVFAFSPYEIYLKSGRDTHVGLVAKVQPNKLAEFTKMNQECEAEAVRKELAAAGIENLQCFARNIEGTEYAVIYFKYAGGRDYLGAGEAFEKATNKIDWKAATSPHPRAKSYGRHWLQMEWINFIHGLDVDRQPTNSLMIGTTIIPEKEMQYRTLHQTVWPGVVDQVIRGKIRNLNVFLVELDGQLVEFLYLEYMGDDQEADDRMNKADPINQRWWKLTDACQRPFSDVTEGNWALLTPVK